MQQWFIIQCKSTCCPLCELIEKIRFQQKSITVV
jgi:hypothetical protein